MSHRQTLPPIPRLPPELIAHIADHIEDQADRLRCSLVSRTWLAFCRQHLKFAILGEAAIYTLAMVLASSGSTLAQTTTDLSLHAHNVTNLFPHLGSFTHLRVLSLAYFRIEIRVPSLPSLTELSLGTTGFNSYDDFSASMAGFPRLERLALANISCGVGPETTGLPTPVFTPAQLQLTFHYATTIDRRIMFSLRPRTLVLVLRWSPRSPDIPIIAEYLRWLGPDLQSLHFSDCRPRSDILSLDVSTNVNLEHVFIDHALGIYHIDPIRLTISPILLSLLSSIAQHATRLREFSLRVRQSNGPGISDLELADLAQLLATPPFAGLRQIRVVVSAFVKEAAPDLEGVVRLVFPDLDDRFVYLEEG